MLEREDELGGCIRTAELTEPGYLHDVFSAWHPLWVGGAAHAELADELAPARARVPEHRPPDGDADARGRGRRSCSARPRRTSPSWARSGAARSSRSCRTPTSPSACSAPSCGRATGCGSACARTGGSVAAARSSSSATSSPRAATGSRRRSPSERAHGVLAPWVLHTGLGPDNARLRVHDAGDRGRGAGGRDADPARRRGAARRGARAPDRGQRRLVRDRPRRRAGAGAGRQGDRRAHSPTERRSRRAGR